MNRLAFAQRRSLLMLTGMAGLLLWPLGALALDPASGSPLLTVTGNVKVTNAGRVAVFDMELLEKLPQHSFETKTPWHKGTTKFTGPLLRDILAATGASGHTIFATALNDYRVTIPMEDVQKHDVIVVRLTNGQPMALRDKGPLLIMYPFDQQPALRSALYFSRCIWQLRGLEVQ
nr:molybdopterin-dependent oxidoreductase [uncultured Roseateles sp.]